MVTEARRLRGEVLDELASTRRWLAEVRTAALRRAADLSRLRDRVASRGGATALAAVTRDILVANEAIDYALAGIEGDLGARVAEIEDEPGGPREEPGLPRRGG